MEKKNQINELKKLILGYLREYTSNPAIESIEENILVAHKLGNALAALKASEQLIGRIGYKLGPIQSLNIDKEDIQRLECIVEREKWSQRDIEFIAHLTSMTCSKRCLLPYIDRQMNWIVVSMLCGSYLSAVVLMRSVFELLIRISTTEKGGMSARIESIPFFEHEEKKAIKQTWKALCSWGHPYEKWLKNMCPVYTSHKPAYHPSYFEVCVTLLQKILDVHLVVCQAQFEMDISAFREIEKEVPIDFSDLPLFQRRLGSG